MADSASGKVDENDEDGPIVEGSAPAFDEPIFGDSSAGQTSFASAESAGQNEDGGVKDDANKADEKNAGRKEPPSWAGKVALAVFIIPFALLIISYAIQGFGNVYIGWGALALRLMQVPASLLLLLIILALSLLGVVYGIGSIVRPAMRSSWFVTLFALVEGASMLYVLFAFVLPWGVSAPVRDIPYLAHPLEGTVIVTGVGEETSYDSDGGDSTSYYLYCVPDDLPGYADRREVFRFPIGYGQYDQWKPKFGEADTNSTLFLGFDGSADLSGKPVYRVEMLPNTETLISFEPVE